MEEMGPSGVTQWLAEEALLTMPLKRQFAGLPSTIVHWCNRLPVHRIVVAAVLELFLDFAADTKMQIRCDSDVARVEK